MPEDRRLAAIMFTDIVGYTKLMGEDEDKAFKVLRKNREIQRPIIKKFRGEWLKEMGDGILASFHTASDAVRCAGEIQQAAKKEGISLRIGIHSGEVVFEGHDVLGDGVNVASRLEELAEDGCINISGAVYKDIKNKAGIAAEFIEEKSLKNVEEPVKVYRVKCEEPKEEVLDENPSKMKTNKLPYYIIGALMVIIIGIVIWQFLPVEKPDFEKTAIVDKSIAVKPFTNDSPDQENEYFCNGMMEDILTNLQKISDLKVKSRTDVEQYRDNTKTIAIMGAELGVAYILEGSVRKAGDNLRITAQLIDVKTGDHLWANTYDGKYTDEIFEFQEEIAKKVASSLKAIITPEEAERIEKKPTANITAYDFMLRAKEENMNYWINYDANHKKLANKLIDKALELDPKSLEALEVKGSIYVAEANYDSAIIYANRLIDIDPEYSGAYFLMGECHRFKLEYDAAIDNYKLTLKYFKQGDLNDRNWCEFLIGVMYCIRKLDYLKGLPYLQNGFDENAINKYSFWGDLSWVFRYIEDYERAEMYNEKMLEIAPESIWWFIRLQSEILQWQGRFEESISFLDSICSITVSNLDMCSKYLFHANVYLGQYNEAEQYFNQLVNADIGRVWELDSVMIAFTYKKLGKEHESKIVLNNVRTSLENMLRKDKSFYVLRVLALLHAVQNEKEESLKYLSEIVDMGQGSTWFDLAERNPIFKNLWGDPEFKAIIKRNREKLENVQAQINEMRGRGEISI